MSLVLCVLPNNFYLLKLFARPPSKFTLWPRTWFGALCSKSRNLTKPIQLLSKLHHCITLNISWKLMHSACYGCLLEICKKLVLNHLTLLKNFKNMTADLARDLALLNLTLVTINWWENEGFLININCTIISLRFLCFKITSFKHRNQRRPKIAVLYFIII